MIGHNSRATPAEKQLAFREKTRSQRIKENTPFDLRWQWEVWLSDLSPNGKLVAFAVRIFASSSGEDSKPSIDALVHLTGLSRQTVVNQLKNLEKQLLIIAERSKGRGGNVYTLRIPERTIEELANVIDFENSLAARRLSDENGQPAGLFQETNGLSAGPLKGGNSLIGDGNSLADRRDITNITTTQNLAREDQKPSSSKVAAIAASLMVATVPYLPAVAAEPSPVVKADRTEIPYAELKQKLMEAGGEAIGTAAGLELLSMPRSWISSGCNLEEDILPAIRARSAKMPKRSINSWNYFSQAVADAKAARTATLPDGRVPARSQSFEERHADREAEQLRRDIENIRARGPARPAYEQIEDMPA